MVAYDFQSLRMRSVFGRSDRTAPILTGFFLGARTHQSLPVSSLVSFHACLSRAMPLWPLHFIPHQFRLILPLALYILPGWRIRNDSLQLRSHSSAAEMNWGPTWSFLRCATYGPRVGHWDGSQGSWSQKNFEIKPSSWFGGNRWDVPGGGFKNLEMLHRAEEVH